MNENETPEVPAATETVEVKDHWWTRTKKVAKKVAPYAAVAAITLAVSAAFKHGGASDETNPDDEPTEILYIDTPADEN